MTEPAFRSDARMPRPSHARDRRDHLISVPDASVPGLLSCSCSCSCLAPLSYLALLPFRSPSASTHSVSRYFLPNSPLVISPPTSHGFENQGVRGKDGCPEGQRRSVPRFEATAFFHHGRVP